ncbi:MAG: response regulator transcription factor [Verrucomicrobiales bacterium]|nr:response regulator transcription factor [Verrucomicrobiales bacterium]
MATKRKIFVVDDCPVTRAGLAHIINLQADLRICGQAGTPTEALEGIAASRPDLVVTDIALGSCNGLELIKSIRTGFRELPILVFSTLEETVYAQRALLAGANGYLMKQALTREVVAAIRRLLRGEPYVSEAIRNHVVRRFAGSSAPLEVNHVQVLSDRELEVFRLLGQGVGTRQIARRLHVSVSTVETHRAHIKEKLELRTAMELVRRAVEWVQRHSQ